MKNELEITRVFNADIDDVFRYFVEQPLVEQWAYPNGFSLKLPRFDAKVGGRYRYEHSDKNGIAFIAEGEFLEVIPGERVVQLDRTIRDRNGKTLFENLENSVDFGKKPNGTEIIVQVKGLNSPEGVEQCGEGWKQSLDNLESLINRERSQEVEQSANL